VSLLSVEKSKSEGDILNSNVDRKEKLHFRQCPISRIGLVKLKSGERPVRYQIPSGEESGTVRAAGAESSRRFLPHVAMVKATDTWQSDNFRAG
jgi:hypothetical protein